MIGQTIYNFCKKIFPINRSLTGNGVRETLKEIKKIVPELNIYEIPTGSKCFDWEVPKEWNCYDAYILTPEGEKICDYKQNNLHVVQYSTPIKKEILYEELEKHLYSLPELPDAIPYITSYYKENWGFCISHNGMKKLKKGKYKVVIDSELKEGSLTYGEIIIKGKEEKEILFTTYVCHPSMANNETSGIALNTFLATYVKSLKNRRFTYRFVFAPETIGAICYINRNLDNLKKNLQAGFVVSCVGDNLNYSYVASRKGNTLADKVALNVLKFSVNEFKQYPFTIQGSDERQYCSPKVDLPVCSVNRSRYGTYKEYHTSLDNMDFVTPEGFNGAYEVYIKIIDILENNYYYELTTFCEPQLGKRGLYPNISTLETAKETNVMMNLLSYADGKHDLIDIAEIIGVSADRLIDMAKKLENHNILVKKDKCG